MPLWDVLVSCFVMHQTLNTQNPTDSVEIGGVYEDLVQSMPGSQSRSIIRVETIRKCWLPWIPRQGPKYRNTSGLVLTTPNTRGVLLPSKYQSHSDSMSVPALSTGGSKA